MGYRVVWSPEAVEDVESIAEYISKDSAFFARAVVTKILGYAKFLAEFPTIGRMVPEYGNKDVRERIVYSYRLIYNISGKTITIVAVIHGRRMLEPILNERIKPKER
jgi:toxin ParE1/3/4